MDQKQGSAFMAYWGLGGDRSLERLYREWTKLLPNLNRPRSITTLKNWSSKFRWQEEMEKMDDDANKNLFDEAKNVARESRIDILKVFRAVVLRFATQLKNNPGKEINSSDVATFWKMVRVEMGLPAEQSKMEISEAKTLDDLLKEDEEDYENQQRINRGPAENSEQKAAKSKIQTKRSSGKIRKGTNK